jgi:translocation and assembly module TamA
MSGRQKCYHGSLRRIGTSRALSNLNAVHLAFLNRVFVLWACAMCAAALAQESAVRYRVFVDAPREFATLLTEGLSLTRWQDDPQMSAELLQRLVDEAVEETRQTLATEGYFSPRVEAAIERDDDPWVVVLRIEPGPRTQVEEYDLQVIGPAAEDAQARAALRRMQQDWSLRRGQPFRQEAWENAKRGAVRELASWRYAGARIARSEARIDPAANSAALTAVVDSGPPYRFGRVDVRGTRRYPEQLVQNVSPFRAGEDFDREKLVLYERRLIETGYFASAHAEADTAAAELGEAPVRVALVEGNSQHVETGVGYSTDVGARVDVRYSNVDVFDSAWRFRSALRLDEKTRNLQFELDSPPLAGGRWNSAFVRTRQADIQNERTRELAFGVAHNWGIERTPSSFIVSAHLEEQTPAGEPTDNRHAVYFGHRATFRRTDDILAPRSGYLGSVEVGGAPPELATRAFLRAVGSASLFWPLGRRDDLLLRGQAGLVKAASREGIPTSFLFRTGGDQTVRGYPLEGIGLQRGAVVLGARRLAWGSAEFTHWISSWGIAAFIDAGDAWDETGKFRPRRGYGVGARFRTPIGPIRADLAYGEETSQFRLHFSVGYVF